jgi:hypothetical protein
MIRFVSFSVVAAVSFVAAQVAQAQPEEGEYYKIKSVNSGMVLSVADESEKTGAKIVQAEPKKGDEAQQWKLVKAGEHYKLVNRKSGKALEVPDASKEQGVQMQQGDDKGGKGGKNQLWNVEKLSDKDKSYVIKAQGNGLVLDVQDADKNVGAAVIQWPLNEKGDRKNQKWEFVPVK